MSLVEDEDVVEAFPAEGADEALGKGILPWGPRGDEDIPLNSVVARRMEILTGTGSRSEFAARRTVSLDEMKRRVLPKRSPNKRMQPTARKARRG